MYAQLGFDTLKPDIDELGHILNFSYLITSSIVTLKRISDCYRTSNQSGSEVIGSVFADDISTK